LTNRFFGDGQTRNAIPIDPQIVNRAYLAPLNYIRKRRTQDFLCASPTYSQVIDIHLPADQSVNVPTNIDVDAALASYKATYVSSGSVLHIERRMVLNLPGQVCTSQIAREVSNVVLTALSDLSTTLEFIKTTNEHSNAANQGTTKDE
jgi:hypothetical protein